MKNFITSLLLSSIAFTGIVFAETAAPKPSPSPAPASVTILKPKPKPSTQRPGPISQKKKAAPPKKR